MAEFSYRTRRKDISSLAGKHVRCLIVGGGIVGAGIASVLAHNGVETVLVEKGDFASGTSSASSKLIHGGIRYLAQGHVKLTRDLLKERNHLLESTDIVKPLDFDILVDDYSWSASFMRFGLSMYSLLGGKPSLARMKRNRGEYPPDVKGYFPYFDAMTDDSRLVLYNIVSAHNKGAACLNYVEVESLEDAGGHVKVRARDIAGGASLEFSADVVVNCTGPWVNRILGMYRPGTGLPVKLSKGVHLVLKTDHISSERAVTFRSHIDRRQMFIIPRGKVVIAGTTDSLVDSPEDLDITDEDRSYIVESVKRIFPGITDDDVAGEYCGIRPLIGKGSNPDRISRDFSMFIHGRMISVGGVKLTDFRNASRKVARKVAAMAGISIDTGNLPAMDYRRPDASDVYSYEVMNECALYPDDIMRRREAISIYRPMDIEPEREKVNAAFARAEEDPVS